MAERDPGKQAWFVHASKLGIVSLSKFLPPLLRLEDGTWKVYRHLAMMPEYVYALHDFHPEHDDEITFSAGQPIEIIEKDDVYNDGWWQGRNLAGKVGLFPQSYTTPAIPVPSVQPKSPTSPTSSAPISNLSLPLKEGQEISPTIEYPSDPLLSSASNDGEMMKATMTDVQKAIEQLGHNDRDGAHSFSFASDTDRDIDTDTDTDRDTDLGDVEEGDWHRNARNKLAEQARRVVEAAAAAAEEENAPLRTFLPPIEVEMSDESEADEDDDAIHRGHHLHPSRQHPHIPEEDEEDEAGVLRIANSDAAILPSENRSHPLTDGCGLLTATVERTSFPLPIQAAPNALNGRTSSPLPGHTPIPSSSPPRIVAPVPVVAPNSAPGPRSMSPLNVSREIHETKELPLSPKPMSVTAQPTSKHSSLTISLMPAAPPQISSELTNVDNSPQKPHPSEWSVDDVIEWLKSKGFGADVTDKFTEQEISGDVLLELDINLLKTEIGIQAFGKRMRIANAIAELRRPPSIVSADQQTPSTHSQFRSQPTSLSQLQSYSYSHSHTSSTQHSLNSPMFASPGFGSTVLSSVMTPESPPHTGEISTAQGAPQSPRRVSDPPSSPGVSVKASGSDVASIVEKVAVHGLGLGISSAVTNGSNQKRLSAQLSLSPSHNTLQPQTALVSPKEDRGALSDSEAAPTTNGKRRRLFGRSTESAKDKSESANASKEAISPLSVTTSPRKKRESLDDASITSNRNKRSLDGGGHKASDRLSLFGGSFGGNLVKSRKQPPRYSSSSSLLDRPEASHDKHSSLSLSRLYDAGRKRTGRPSTTDGSLFSKGSSHQLKDAAKEKAKTTDKERVPSGEKDTTNKTSQQGSRGPNSLTPGKSIIEQIGTADHSGWMRKKGDHYNSWKVRYFIIKGPHLYILRSDNKIETKIKGYINIVGYKVIADENIDPGRYGFRLVHDNDKSYYFSSEEQLVIREWMKAIMKATIGRDYSKPVVSSVNIPTIPLSVAQAMNPAPRPPSPTARDATQKALRRENPNQLSTRDARILMGLPAPETSVRHLDAHESERGKLDSFFANAPVSSANENLSGPPTPKATKGAPPRPSRELRRMDTSPASEIVEVVNPSLVEWANSRLPTSLQISDTSGSLCNGLALLRLAESIKGKPSSPPVPDSAFPSGPHDDKLDGLFRLFDFLLDHDVKMGSVSINDVRQGKREKIIQLLTALKVWEDKRRAIEQSLAQQMRVQQSGAYGSLLIGYGQ